MRKGYNRIRTEKRQRRAVVTELLRTALEDFLDVLLHLLSIDLHISFKATCDAIKLMESGILNLFYMEQLRFFPLLIRDHLSIT